MSNQAIQQELSRVRKLKRALESEVELLRSDMEKGTLHIRINPEIKKDLAEALVEIYQLGYDSNIHTNYYTDGEIVMKVSPGYYNVPSDVDFKTISVKEILDSNNQRYFAWDEFDNRELKDIIDAQYWTEMEESEEDDILYFLQENHEDIYDEFLDQQKEIAFDFFLREIPDEYTVEIN